MTRLSYKDVSRKQPLRYDPCPVCFNAPSVWYGSFGHNHMCKHCDGQGFVVRPLNRGQVNADNNQTD